MKRTYIKTEGVLYPTEYFEFYSDCIINITDSEDVPFQIYNKNWEYIEVDIEVKNISYNKHVRNLQKQAAKRANLHLFFEEEYRRLYKKPEMSVSTNDKYYDSSLVTKIEFQSICDKEFSEITDDEIQFAEAFIDGPLELYITEKKALNAYILDMFSYIDNKINDNDKDK